MKKTRLVLPFALACSLSGCGAYLKTMNGLMDTMGGAFDAQNALNVPVCKVTVFAPDDEKLVKDNEIYHQVLLAPGEKKNLTYPIATQADTPVPKDLSLRVYGCETKGAVVEPGGVIATLAHVDVASQVTIH